VSAISVGCLLPYRALDQRDHAIEEVQPCGASVIRTLSHRSHARAAGDGRGDRRRVSRWTGADSPGDCRFNRREAPPLDTSASLAARIALLRRARHRLCAAQRRRQPTRNSALTALVRAFAWFPSACGAAYRRLVPCRDLGDGLGRNWREHGGPQPTVNLTGKSPRFRTDDCAFADERSRMKKIVVSTETISTRTSPGFLVESPRI